jgi:hypothetical protein
MAAAINDHDHNLAIIQDKIAALEAQVQLLVVEYDSHVSAHEETKVVKKQAVVLQQRAKASQQQPGRKYSTNVATMRRRVYRSIAVLSPAESKAITGKPNAFLPTVQKILADKGIHAVKLYLLDKLRVAVAVKGHLHHEHRGRTMNSAIKLGLDDSNKMKLKLDAPVHFADTDIVWTIKHQNSLLYEIKKSSLPESGFGVYTKKAFKKSAFMGVYLGDEISMTAKARNTQSIVGIDGLVYQASRNDSWFGLHFANDPQFSKYEQKEQTDESDLRYNIKVHDDLGVYALEDIEKDSELFLHYNLIDGFEQKEQQKEQEEEEDDIDANDDELDNEEKKPKAQRKAPKRRKTHS